ncbi:hypothetical protein ASG21_04130 [Chryseobacterium sp. Leaf394]|nr:hypothetical protein ASG21_04130 [Chryseobacterium sp. Leaf394]
MWGKTWEASVGKTLLENGYESWHATMHEKEIDEIKNTKLPIRGEVSFPHATLGKRIYDYIFTPVLDKDGELVAVAGATRDVTDRKNWEESLQINSRTLQQLNKHLENTNHELTATLKEIAQVNDELKKANEKIAEGEIAFRLAVNAADFGTWFIHSITREFITDARLKELFGYYENEPLSIEQALAQITEEYRPTVAEKLENAIYNNGDYDVTYPVIGLHDNRLRWLRAIGNLKADPSGAFSAFTGVVMDITDQYLANAEIKRTEENLRMAVEAAGLGTFQMSADDRILVASPKLKEFFGFYPDEDMPLEAAVNQIHADFRASVTASIERTFMEKIRFNMEYQIIGYHDKKKRWVRTIGEVQEKGGKEYFTGVIHDITDNKLDEIRKNDFIGMVSHELKTPLTSINIYLQLLLQKAENSHNQFVKQALEQCLKQVKNMIEMINGFLNVSRLESGKLHIDKTDFDISDFFKEIQTDYEIQYSSHDLVFNSPESMIVNGDRLKLAQVINNLVGNAVKYSGNKTSIYISIEKINDKIKVIVKDEGIGIKPENLDRLFDRYYRVEQESIIAGFGIGLYLSAEIIKAHGGKIWAESEFSRGSTFFFEVPVS